MAALWWAYTPFTRYSRLSDQLYNRFHNGFDNRVERTAAVRSTGCQTGLYNRFDNRLYTRYSRLSSRFDNRLYRVNEALRSFLQLLLLLRLQSCVQRAARSRSMGRTSDSLASVASTERHRPGVQRRHPAARRQSVSVERRRARHAERRSSDVPVRSHSSDLPRRRRRTGVFARRRLRSTVASGR